MLLRIYIAGAILVILYLGWTSRGALVLIVANLLRGKPMIFARKSADGAVTMKCPTCKEKVSFTKEELEQENSICAECGAGFKWMAKSEPGARDDE